MSAVAAWFAGGGVGWGGGAFVLSSTGGLPSYIRQWV